MQDLADTPRLLFTDSELDRLRTAYATFERVDPSLDWYPKLAKMLDEMPDARLGQIADADIKFVSTLARNRVRRRDTGSN